MRKSIFLSLILLLALCHGASARGPLADGHWVKVGVDTTGVFEISYEQLRELGFTMPSRVSVYGSGGVVAADNSFDGPFGNGFEQAPAMHTADERLLFFAEGPVRGELKSGARLGITQNFYDSHAFYFLSDKEGFREIPKASPALSPAVPATTHSHILYYDRQAFSPGHGGAIMLSNKLMGSQTEDYSFALEGYDSSAADGAALYCEYGIKSDERGSIGISVSHGFELVDLLKPQVGASTNTNESYRRGTIAATLQPDEGIENGIITFTANGGQYENFCAVDFLYIIYRRSNTPGKESELILNYDNAPGAVEFAGIPADFEVWNVTAGTGYSRLAPSENPAVFATGQAKRLVAFSPSAAHRRVCSAERVENQDYSSAHTPDILIFAAPALMSGAEELADLHRQWQGADVLIAPQDKVFDEFSEGSRTPMAFRRLAKMLYDRNPDKLKNIILYGGGSFENLLLDNKSSQLVTFQAENPEESRWLSYNYCADQYFGMLSPDYRHSDILYTPMLVNVGRISVESPSAATAYNAKVRRFFENGPSPAAFLRAVMCSDLGDKYQHFDQNDQACEALKSGSLMTIARVDRYFYAVDPNTGRHPGLEKAAGASLVRGAGYIGYSGHGGASVMGDVIDKGFVDSYSYDTAPFGMFATCEAYAFDRGGFSICNHMLGKEHGGVVCMLASGRSVILNYNKRLGTEIASCYASLKPGDTYGDLLRRARDRILSENTTISLCRNTMCYNFGGDPALPVPVAEFGISLAPTDMSVLTPLKATELSGYVTDDEGRVVEDFYGSVEIAIHCNELTRVHVGDDETVKSAIDDSDILCSATAEVSAGRFSVSLTVPVSSDGGGANRISMAAVDAAGRCAAGVDMSYTIASEAAPDDEIDFTAPKILNMYIDSDEFRPGDVVGSEYVFHAVVDPSPSGMRITSGLERSVKLTLDRRETLPSAAAYGRAGADGLVYFDIPFPEAAPGKHTIFLEVANNVGLTASSSVDFVVGKQELSAVLSHDKADTSVARDFMEFSLDGADGAWGRLIIVDRAGRTVLSEPACSFPYRWNLSGADGARVPDGPYRAWVILGDGASTGSTDAIHFTVLRPLEGNK